MEQVVFRVLARYPAFLRQGPLEPLGSRGGFSGALLWRLSGPGGPLCLRGTAPHERAEHLAWRHRLMTEARAAGLRFVPAVLPCADGASFVEAEGRCWELMEWLPGRADYRESPSRERLEAAARALALVHDAWGRHEQGKAVCPAVLRRLELAGNCQVPAGQGPATPLQPLLSRLGEVVREWLPHLPGWLLPWQGRVCLLQPCLRDVWHDHLLFEGDRLAGLVDYAAADVDGVATDLARMLGSLAADDDSGWCAGLAAYREVRSLSAEEEDLARVLDRAGAVLGLANWLRWLMARQQGPALGRVEELLRRVEGWSLGLTRPRPPNATGPPGRGTAPPGSGPPP
jgi:Ser/Thr protein kinase RdoA (MazF antagonist)